MRDRLAIGAAIIALTFLSYFQFPGHTYLGSDTQIYVPMLEHIWDPSALTRDLVATKPHLHTRCTTKSQLLSAGSRTVLFERY